LTYAYARRTAWIEGLAPDAHPMGYDLCAEHARTLTVPHGWSLEDRRLRLGGGQSDSVVGRSLAAGLVG
jgi:hypothetical protein